MGYTPHIVTGVWVGNDDNIAMNKSIQGGTVPALIWKDVMTVATEPYGNAEFNYPEIKLVPFTDKKAIGEDEENEENKEADENTVNMEDSHIMSPEEIAQQVNNIINNAENKTELPKQMPQEQTVPTPKPVTQAPAPKPASAPIPIPMAVPEGLR